MIFYCIPQYILYIKKNLLLVKNRNPSKLVLIGAQLKKRMFVKTQEEKKYLPICNFNHEDGRRSYIYSKKSTRNQGKST